MHLSREKAALWTIHCTLNISLPLMMMKLRWMKGKSGTRTLLRNRANRGESQQLQLLSLTRMSKLVGFQL